MSGPIVLTGATGAVGLPLVAALLSRPAGSDVHVLIRKAADAETLLDSLRPGIAANQLGKLKMILGDLANAEACMNESVTGGTVSDVIHCAAFTKFREWNNEWASTNVEGTRRLLAWRRNTCPEARFVHLSTLCVGGKMIGAIPEGPLARPEGFVNGYEESKWEAEQIVQEAGGPVAVLRLATAIGSAADGSLHRVGAFHHVLRWVYRGLLPLIPGDANTKLELIPTEYAVGSICRLLDQAPADGAEFYHICRGQDAIPLGELINVCAEFFRSADDAWRRGQVAPPVLASLPAFEEFRRSVLLTRDMLFTQVLESVDSFLPELFFPKHFAKARAESLSSGQAALGDWRPLLGRVLDFSMKTDFGRRS